MLITCAYSIKECEFVVSTWFDEWPSTFRNIKYTETVDILYKAVRENVFKLFIVYDGPVIVSSGCICLNTHMILNIITIPEFRNMGYATSLLKQMIIECINLSIDTIYISCEYKHVLWLKDVIGFKDKGVCRDELIIEHLLEYKCGPMSPMSPMSPILKSVLENEKADFYLKPH